MRLLAIFVFVAAFLSLKNQINSKAEYIHHETLSTCDELIETIEIFKNNPTKQNLSKTRKSYKKIQKYVAYYLPSDEKEINGAPVWGVIEDGRIADKVQPHGLQVIEENIGHNNVLVATEIDRLKQRVGSVKIKLSEERFSEKDIIEANRFEIIRITTLGITGYENVSFSDPIEENITDLKQIKSELSLFENSKNINKLIGESIHVLEQANFENLDRVKLTREYLDPLYKEILKLHKELGYENISHKGSFPVNYEAESMYSNEFYNGDFYTKFRQSTTTQKQIELGKTLFFDPILSKNNERACASCHDPQKGFTDGLAKSRAFNFEGHVDRNSPTLLNAAYQSNFFWDMRSENLEDQVHHVVNSKKEFNTNISEIIFKLRESNEYHNDFAEVYKDEQPINTTNIKTAITAYIRSLSSFNSKFDQYMRKEIDVIEPEVIEGYNLFAGKANCATCHFAPSFNGTVPPYYFETDGEVLGVPDSSQRHLDHDLGRVKNMLPQYQYEFLIRMFKTPTVRNVEITAPYMHNGCFNNLNELMAFYNNGGGEGEGYTVGNQTLSPDKLNLTDQEVSSIIKFMESLTDNPFENDKPEKLPVFSKEELNKRVVGGKYYSRKHKKSSFSGAFFPPPAVSYQMPSRFDY